MARASVVAMMAGADFIKTSTGKVSPAATMPVTLVMLEAIRDFERGTDRAGRLGLPRATALGLLTPRQVRTASRASSTS